MKKKKLRTAACLILVGTVLAAFMAIAAEVGSQGDPLVTLSYLNETFMNQILTRVDEKIAVRNEGLKTELEQKIGEAEREILLHLGGSFGSATGGSAVTFTSVTLTGGQTLLGTPGSEIMLRSGSAACYIGGSGLVDNTDGTITGPGGMLQTNHLYLTTDNSGVTASGNVVLLVRGDYTIV